MNQQATNIALIAIGLLVGILGIVFLTKSVRRLRTTGSFIFPFMPAILLFVITFPDGSNTSNASVEYIGKLSGPIAAYLIITLLIRRYVEKDINAEEKQVNIEKLKASEAVLKQSEESLREELANTKSSYEALRESVETARPQPLPAKTDQIYYHPQDRNRTIIIRTGTIRQVRNIDVVVNSENTAMALARIYDPSMSGTLRYLDADLRSDGYVEKDWMAEQLAAEIKKQNATLPVMAGTVFVTPTNKLAAKGIRYIFHAAVVKGEVGAGYQPVIELLDVCIQNCYQHFADIATKDAMTTILFPLLGAGSGKLSPLQSANIILPQIIQCMGDTPQVKTTYILAWVESHRQALRNVAEKLHLEVANETTPT